MIPRTLLTASAAALATVALVAPAVHAQDADESGTTGSVASLGSEGADASGGDGPEADDGGSGAEGGSLGSGDGSLDDLAPEGDGSTCELPGLGGSLAKFYPLFGGPDVPPVVMDFVTTTLDSFPNVLDLVAGAGNGAALVGQTGSLAEGLCTTIFGGEMALPVVTVMVDDDGNPTATVTGTAVPEVSGAQTSTSTGAATTGATGDTGSSGSLQGEGSAPPPTTVPTPDADDDNDEGSDDES